MSAIDLISSIDPCTGQARASVPLLFRSGRGGLDLSLIAAYDSGTLETSTQWNQDAPTGILGLGWELQRDRIFARCEQSAAHGDITYYLYMKGVLSPLVCTAAASNGTSGWATARYRFWKITYDRGREVWTVIDEDGITHLFGDSTSGKGTVDWGVAWGDWLGPNGTRNQRAEAVGWSISTITDLFGNQLTYGYTQTQAQVASMSGLSYTQASYLSSITGTDGSQIQLNYQPKSDDEYQDPHTNPAPPNPWQDRFETQYLEKAILVGPASQTLASVVLGYGPTMLGSGTLTKRLLTSITRYSSTGVQVEPAALFSYWGQNAGDNVSATSVQSGQALYGALKQVTSPLGGTLNYAYQALPLSYASRSLAITPSGDAAGWINPVVYATDDYVLATWQESTNVHVQSYRWNGRWTQYDVMTLPLGSASYDTLQVATSPTCCAVQTGSTVYLASIDDSRPGAWFPAATFTLSPPLGTGETATLVAGRDFAAVLAKTSGNLLTFRFTGSDIGSSTTATGWVADNMTSLGSMGTAFALAAKGAMLAALAVSTSGTATLTLQQMRPSGAWNSVKQAFTTGGLAASNLSLEMGWGFAVAWSTAAVSKGYTTAYASYWWSADGTLISGQTWGTWAGSASAAVVPMVSGTTVVVGLTIFRFTGTGWVSFSSNKITYRDAAVSPVLSVGSDLVARKFTTTSGGMIADLLVYDPIGKSWSVPSGMIITGTSALAAVAPDTDYGVANYAVIGNALWFRGAAGTWTSVLTLPSGLGAADMSTIQLLGENYLVFQQGTGTASVAINVFMLQNGGVVDISPAISLTDQQITLPSGSAGSLVSRTGFAAYTGTFGSDSSQLMLYRPVFGNVTGAQTGYTVASVTSDNGYSSESGINGSVSMAFDFQAGTIDGSGTVPLFNTVTAVPGQIDTANPASGTLVMAYYTGLTGAEPPATAYPMGGQDNAANYTLAMSGTLYQSTATATGVKNAQTPVSQLTLFHQVTLLPLGNGGVGFYDRYVQLSRMQDGVTSTETLTYNTQIGFPASRSTQVNNSAGTQDSFSEQYTYFYSSYDPNLSLNLLSPVIQRVTQSQPAGAAGPAVIGIDITTWRDWSSGQNQWAPDRRYRALSSSASFSSWTYGQTPPTTEFLLTTQVLSLSPQGMILEVADGLGTLSTIGCDLSQTYPVFMADNSAPGQALWYGCELYESFGDWITTVPGQTLADALTGVDFHTGTQSLCLAVNTPQEGPLLQVQPSDQTRRCLFSCWAKTASNFEPANGHASWTITCFDAVTSNPVGTPITLDLTPAGAGQPSAVGQWSYFQVTLDLPSLVKANSGKPLGISIQAGNANTQQPCYVDELRFMPIDCGFTALVYDPISFRITAVIDGTGQCRQVYYDHRDTPYLAVGPNGQVQALEIATYARWISSTGAFQAPFPNVTLSLGSAVGGKYYSFHNPNTSDWKFSSASWTIAGGKLNYSGSTSATATCNQLQAPNQAARVSVSMAATAGASVAFGNGTYFMRWTYSASGDSGTWTLEQTGASDPTLVTNSTAGFYSEWLFAIIDGLVIAYAGSVQLFAYQPAAPSTPSTTPAITLMTNCASSFDDLTVLQDPSFSLSAYDGLGQPFSYLSLLGYQPDSDKKVLFPSLWVVTSSNTFYDNLGRPYVSGQALNAPLQVTPALAPAAGYDLIPQDQTTYLYSSQGQSLSLSTYLDGANGRTFTQAAFEASPLGRPVSVDAPRGAFTSGNSYCTVQTVYGSSSTVGNGPSTGTGLYRVVTRQALTQTTAAPSLSAPAVTILEQITTDTAGRVLLRQSGPAAGPLLQTGYDYNAAGLLSIIYYPNFYAPPTGSVAADWQESRTYDFLGRMISRTQPDTGTTQWAYDSVGRLRFVYNANGVPVRPHTIQTILYYKYDALSRVVETGYISDPRYNWGSTALEAMLDVTAFPVIVAGTPAPGTNQAAGATSKVTVYDTDARFIDGASFTPFLIGRPTQVSITPSDGAPQADQETYTYDASGNVLAKTVVMPGLSPATGWTTAYTYNAQDQVLSLAYPPMETTAANPTPSGSVTWVGYGYDRLGRLVAVGGQPTGAVVDPNNPPLPLDMSYAGYVRNTFGQLIAASYNNAGGATGSPLLRTFNYDENQRLASIADPYFTQTLTYNASATLTGWSYFQSMVSSMNTTYPGSPQATQPLPGYIHNFKYDGNGRLITATNSLGNAFDLSLGGKTGAFDANGNILAMARGVSQNNYTYTPPTGSSPSNRLTGISTSVDASVDFTQSTPAMNGWTVASSNGGPSTSGLTKATPVNDGSQALKLAGGSAGHYEVLGLSTFLTPGVSYTLTWTAATSSDYPASPGTAINGACWYVILNGATGPVAVLPLGAVASSPSAWTTGTLTLDLTPAGIARMAGIFTDVVWIGIELRNLCRGSSGSAGADVYLKSVGLSSTAATAATYGYDPLGRVISVPSREIISLTYDPCTGLTASISIGSSAETANNLTFAYGANDLRSRATLTPAAGSGGAPQRTITLTGAYGELLATQTTSGTTVTSTAYYINGVQGPFAMLVGPGTHYLLTDHLGSLRAVVDGPTGTLLAATDTQPFGAAQRTWGTTGTDIGFTGQRLDLQTGLYNYNARLYDPSLGRFLAPDPAGQYASPYVYVGNNPGSMVDPDGNHSISAQATLTVFNLALLVFTDWEQLGYSISNLLVTMGARWIVSATISIPLRFVTTKYDYGTSSAYSIPAGMFVLGFVNAMGGVAGRAAISFKNYIFNIEKEEGQAFSKYGIICDIAGGIIFYSLAVGNFQFNRVFPIHTKDTGQKTYELYKRSPLPPHIAPSYHGRTSTYQTGGVLLLTTPAQNVARRSNWHQWTAARGYGTSEIIWTTTDEYAIRAYEDMAIRWLGPARDIVGRVQINGIAVANPQSAQYYKAMYKDLLRPLLDYGKLDQNNVLKESISRFLNTTRT